MISITDSVPLADQTSVFPSAFTERPSIRDVFPAESGTPAYRVLSRKVTADLSDSEQKGNGFGRKAFGTGSTPARVNCSAGSWRSGRSHDARMYSRSTCTNVAVHISIADENSIKSLALSECLRGAVDTGENASAAMSHAFNTEKFPDPLNVPGIDEDSAAKELAQKVSLRDQRSHSYVAGFVFEVSTETILLAEK